MLSKSSTSGTNTAATKIDESDLNFIDNALRQTQSNIEIRAGNLIDLQFSASRKLRQLAHIAANRSHFVSELRSRGWIPLLVNWVKQVTLKSSIHY